MFFFFLSLHKFVLLNFHSCVILTFLMPWYFSSIRMVSFASLPFSILYTFFSEFLCQTNYLHLRSDHRITFPPFSILKIACFLLQFILLFKLRVLFIYAHSLGVCYDSKLWQKRNSKLLKQTLLSHGIKVFKEGLQLKLNQGLEQYIQDLSCQVISLWGDRQPLLPRSEGGSWKWASQCWN